MGRKTIDLPDGSRYVGEVNEDGVPHGRDVLSWPSGARVEGEWRNGLPNGHGVRTEPDETRFEGDFRTGKASRHSRMVGAWPASSEMACSKGKGIKGT